MFCWAWVPAAVPAHESQAAACLPLLTAGAAAAPLARLHVRTANDFYVNTSCLLASPHFHVLQEPRLRRLHVRTANDIKMDPERPEYHRAIAHWARPGGFMGR